MSLFIFCQDQPQNLLQCSGPFINPESSISSISHLNFRVTLLSAHSIRPFTNSLCVFAIKTVQLSQTFQVKHFKILELIPQAEVMPDTFSDFINVGRSNCNLKYPILAKITLPKLFTGSCFRNFYKL